MKSEGISRSSAGTARPGKPRFWTCSPLMSWAAKKSGIEVRCEKPCRVLTGVDWKNRLAGIRGSLVFLDELARFTASEEFASEIRHSDNYFIIVTREPLANLPYSVEEVYGIRTSGKYGGLKQTWNEFYHIYGDQNRETYREPDTVIVEDSNSGYDFFSHVYNEKRILCVSAQCTWCPAPVNF